MEFILRLLIMVDGNTTSSFISIAVLDQRNFIWDLHIYSTHQFRGSGGCSIGGGACSILIIATCSSRKPNLASIGYHRTMTDLFSLHDLLCKSDILAVIFRIVRDVHRFVFSNGLIAVRNPVNVSRNLL